MTTATEPFVDFEKALLDTILDMTATEPRAAATDIAKRMETTATVVIRSIQDLRAKGVLIAWDNGYFLARSFGEAEPTSDLLWQRALEAVQCARTFDRAMEVRFGVGKTISEQYDYLFGEAVV